MYKVSFIIQMSTIIDVGPIVLNVKTDAQLEKYMARIQTKCRQGPPDLEEESTRKSTRGSKGTKGKEKVEGAKPYVPTVEEYHMIYQNQYNVQQLKYFAKTYKLKIGGNKQELTNRLYCYLKLSSHIVKIQRVYRGHLVRQYMGYHGPALLRRELCNNSSDFYTMEPMTDVKYNQFISYKDTDGFIYGFDILSLYNLIIKSGAKNPYNRKVIPAFVLDNIKSILRLSRILEIDVVTEIKGIEHEISAKKSSELRVLELFQNMNVLGHYSDPAWFYELSQNKLLRLVFELRDIWNYRAQIMLETKRAIFPPHGDPFYRVHFNLLRVINMDSLQNVVIGILENFINHGIDHDSKVLGAYYVLIALTLVSHTAATSMPLLYQSVAF